MTAASSPENQRGSWRATLFCFTVSFAFLLATHAGFLRLPYYWDELGYFIPAARDLFASGALVPRSTLPNIHPPLFLAYLAGAWRIFGFSIVVTRVAIIALGAASLTALFLLAQKLPDPAASSSPPGLARFGAPAAWTAVALLAVSPPFVAQSMLAHLDLAAAFWTLVALRLFFDGRLWPCALASTALVLTKETGILVPFILAAFGRRDPRSRALLILPAAALGSWLLLLRAATGHWAGNAAFEQYNIAAALLPGRVPLVLFRRLYQLGISNFHWMAALLIAWAARRRRAFRGSRWRVITSVAAGYVLLHSLVGGAILLRYLLPALALFYLAAAAALGLLAPRLRCAATAMLLAGLALSNWWNPPYPFSYEDNLAAADFVRLHQQAAAWLSQKYPERVVTTAWPLTDELSNPLGGYVSRPVRVYPIENFQPAAWGAADPARIDLVALYSRSWEPAGGWQRWPPAARLLRRYFAYEPQVSRGGLIVRFHLRPLARWQRRGQWIEILAAAPAPD